MPSCGTGKFVQLHNFCNENKECASTPYIGLTNLLKLQRVKACAKIVNVRHIIHLYCALSIKERLNMKV